MAPGTLSAEQRRLLDRLLDQKGVGSGTAMLQRYAGERASLPMSFAQQRIWFFDRLQPAETIYNVAGAARLRGRLDVAVLKRCLEEVVRRHEVLRTTYLAMENRPVQRVRPPGEVALPVVDLRDLTPQARAAAVEQRCDAEVKRPFDLERGPMLRPMLLRVADDEHLLLLSQHHIATDGWSLNILLREVSALYAAFSAGAPSPLPELAIQYGDFAAWQRDWLTGDVLEQQLAYWRTQLGDSRLVDLATGLPRPNVLTWSGGTLRYELPAGLVRRLAALADSERATMYMALVAAQSVVLSRRSGQDDIVIGCPVANRNRAEVQSLIGCFVNELPLRMDTSGGPSYRDLLRQAREVCLGAYANQDVPFEKIVEAVNPERDAMSHAPLVRHQLGLHNEPQWRVELPDLTFEIAALSTGTARFDLEIDLSPDPSGGITGMVYFSTDLYTEPVVRRLLDSLTTVIEGVVDDPDLTVWRLPLLGDAERRQLAGESADRQPSTAVPVTLDELVGRHAADAPDALALEHGPARTTYRELDERANRLAHWLRHLGVRPGVPVPVCLPPSAWQLAAILAVLRAGGVAVPVDPGYPPATVHAIVRDTGARLVLTDADTMFLTSLRLEELDAAVRTIALDTVTERMAAYPVTAPEPVTGPDALAFVNYRTERGTGGEVSLVATGNTHASVLRRLRFLIAAFGPGTGEAVLVDQPGPLDTGPFDLWWPLAAGARLVLPDGADGTDRPAEIVRWSAAGLRARLAAGGGTRPPRQVVIGDEAPWPTLLAELRRVWPGTALAVLHGPVQAAADLIAKFFEPGVGPPGRLRCGARAVIIDEHSQPAPSGLPGELCLEGLPRPYGPWRRSAGPEPAREDGRLGTGLRARWLADGELDVLGPIADAVSIRHHRVELTEVSGVLATHPEVERAVVLPVAGPAGTDPAVAAGGAVDPELVAYLTLRHRDGGEDEATRERRIFEATYTGRSAEDDPVLNIGGWHSPHTGEHIPAVEMREWADGTMRRILRLRPRKVLEIGCRTGPLLFRLAPRVEQYTATDLSSRALGRIRRHGDWLATKADSVELLRRTVDDFTGFASDSFDTVVLDALVQYFPSPAFLERVLCGAARVVGPTGHIFVGNVRSLPLLDALRLSVRWGQEETGYPADQLRQLVAQDAAAEEELVLDPRAFLDLASRVPGVVGVSLLPRLGRSRNELTLYRYDVVLHFGGPAHTEPGDNGLDEVDWVGAELTVEAAGTLLCGRASAPIVLRGVPDGRLSAKLSALRALDDRRVATVGELTESIRPAEVLPGGPVDPADLAAVAADQGYDTYVRQALSGPVGAVDVVLTPHDDAAGSGGPLPGAYRPQPATGTASLANDPVTAARRRTATVALRGHLQERLPGYLVPGRFVLLAGWPLDRAGTLDRAALPAPAARAAADAVGREPRTDTERAIAKIWSDALGLDTIGVHDDFFTLGGHSLLGAEVVEQVRDVYEVELPLGRLFEAPTVAAVAGYVDQCLTRPGASPAVAPIGRIDRSDYQTRRARLLATGASKES